MTAIPTRREKGANPSRPQGVDVAELSRLREREKGFKAALERIASYGCENYTGEDCLGNPDRSRDAKYSAERWCLPCHAVQALAGSALQEKGTDG